MRACTSMHGQTTKIKQHTLSAYEKIFKLTNNTSFTQIHRYSKLINAHADLTNAHAELLLNK